MYINARACAKHYPKAPHTCRTRDIVLKSNTLRVIGIYIKNIFACLSPPDTFLNICLHRIYTLRDSFIEICLFSVFLHFSINLIREQLYSRHTHNVASELHAMGSRIPMCGTSCDKTMAGVPYLLDALQKLSEDQDSCDVAFVVGREDERIYAHSIILHAR